LLRFPFVLAVDGVVRFALFFPAFFFTLYLRIGVLVCSEAKILRHILPPFPPFPSLPSADEGWDFLKIFFLI
jgi:hypothetical protein